MPSQMDYQGLTKELLSQTLSADLLGSLKQLFHGDPSAKITIMFKADRIYTCVPVSFNYCFSLLFQLASGL